MSVLNCDSRSFGLRIIGPQTRRLDRAKRRAIRRTAPPWTNLVTAKGRISVMAELKRRKEELTTAELASYGVPQKQPAQAGERPGARNSG